MDETELWILNNKKVCICGGIPRYKIAAAIKAGADTVEKVNKAIGSGRGGCGGKRCSVTIAEMLAETDD